MINILIPLAGSSAVFDLQHYPYPLPLTEVCGKPMIEHVVRDLNGLSNEIQFIFIVKNSDCQRFHLDYTLSLLAPGCRVVKLDGETNGALCSALMAISYINNETPLVISNFNQLFENGVAQFFNELKDTKCDAGCLTFDSVHPRWSYVQINQGNIVEAAEKKPISRNAIAGFYYFAKGEFFIQAAKSSILNQSLVNERYYISSTFNELILDGKTLKTVTVPNKNYISFYSPQRIDEYENLVLNVSN